MKKNIVQKVIFGAAALLLLAACTQDELAGDGTQLPEDKYSLKISSVSLSAEVTDEPWGASHTPQTRAAENPDGNSSFWEEGDEIQVQIDNNTPDTYVLHTDGTVDEEKSRPVYWTSTAFHTLSSPRAVAPA